MYYMRICFIAAASSIHTVRWVNALSEKKHDIHLITMHKELKDKINPAVTVYDLPFKSPHGYYMNYPFAKKTIQSIKPDVVNTHYASGYGTLSRLINFKPTLLSVWGSDLLLFPYAKKRNMKILIKNLRAANAIATTSNVLKEQTNHFLTSPKEIFLTPFGVDLNLFSPNYNYSEEFITIGIVKSLEEVYGIRYLIEAISILLKVLSIKGYENISEKIRLLIVGGGSQLSSLELIVKNLKLENITTFTGSVPHSNVPQYLKKIDIYCAPSLSESFGVAVIEASACALPVIVSNVGGLPEVVINNETGFLVEPKDAENIAEKLFELVINKNKRRIMGSRGRDFVYNFYNWQTNVLQLEQTYMKIMGNN